MRIVAEPQPCPFKLDPGRNIQMRLPRWAGSRVHGVGEALEKQQIAIPTEGLDRQRSQPDSASDYRLIGATIRILAGH